MNQCIMYIPVAIGTGENNYSEFHGTKIRKTIVHGLFLTGLMPVGCTVLLEKNITDRKEKQGKCYQPAGCIKISAGVKCGKWCGYEDPGME
jgi:hypothetical protein